MTSTFEDRQLVAIMFTDVVDHTASTQRNEPLALDLLKEHDGLLRVILRKHRGREIKHTGDGFLVTFPDVLDACRCAVEIQLKLTQRNHETSQTRRIPVRIGIHIGDVVHVNEDVWGDSVNVANRIMGVAREDQVCVSVDVARQVRNKIQERLVKIGKRTLKNIEQPVELWRILLPGENACLVRLRSLVRPKIIRAAGLILALVLVGAGIRWFWGILATQKSSIEILGARLADLELRVAASGGRSNVLVNTRSNQSWTASSSVPWIRIVSGQRGTGSGAVFYSVEANPSTHARTGTIAVGGQTVTLKQLGRKSP